MMRGNLLAGLGLLAFLVAGCQSAAPAVPRLDFPAQPGLLAAPPLPAPLPAPRPPRSSVDLLSVLDLKDDHLGVGTLAPTELNQAGADWISDMALPMYSSPGEHLGWLINGWIVDSVPPVSKRPLLTRALVPTRTQALALQVVEVREDGWFRLRYAPPGSDDASLGWAHVDHLRLGGRPLEVKLWNEWFSAEGAALEYRKAEVRHALRGGPDAKAELVAWIGASHEIEPLETSGDWMRVKVTQPSRLCAADPSAVKAASAEGWIRWNSPEKGPWIWFAGDCR
ncbi:hypothetical protein DESUT3_08890 [Desulfuromonas versatilis]|uniref:SH3 domain-containing protein n=1 Tax=Desulfuromonas versatilis TaxID=2802975 RepID=A0ABM8HQ43_9BACT|nr:hypothetical protein [Desulfuromonas versatilis]BCR03820.1 hypothetical protein DESUT3_08890 [Desulfuromonas versatilis]